LHLSPEEIAAAEACGVSFLPASDAQVQRLAMQRKVFYRAGAPILATRGDGLFETVGTLQQLIEEGRRQQRDLSQWLDAAEPDAATPSATPLDAAALPELLREAAPEPEAARPAPVEPMPAPVAAEAAAPPPKRPRQKRRRPEPAALDVAPDVAPGVMQDEPAAEPEPEPEPGTADTAEAGPPQELETAAGLVEGVFAALPRSPARASGRAAARAPAAAVEAPGQDRGKRWLMAGAARRGRAGKHWSTRQR
jgi:hypothetical protein